MKKENSKKVSSESKNVAEPVKIPAKKLVMEGVSNNSKKEKKTGHTDDQKKPWYKKTTFFIGVVAFAVVAVVIGFIVGVVKTNSVTNKLIKAPNNLQLELLSTAQELQNLPVLEPVQIKSNINLSNNSLFVEKIQVEPATEISVYYDITSSTLNVSPARKWDFGKKYSLLIPSGQYGDLVLLQDFNLEFTTSLKAMSFESVRIFADSFYNEKHEVKYGNKNDDNSNLSDVSEIKFVAYKVTEEHLKQSLSKLIKYEENQVVDITKQPKIAEWKQKNDTKLGFLLINFPLKDVGIYGINLLDNKGDIKDQVFLILNTYGVTLRTDSESGTFFAQSLKDGSIIKNYQITAYRFLPSISEVSKINIDENLKTIRDLKFLSATIGIIKKDGEVGLINIQPEDDSDVEHPYFIAPSKVITTINYDKPYYSVNDQINYKVIIRNRVNGAYVVPRQGTTYTIEYKSYVNYDYSTYTPRYQTVKSLILVSDAFGTLNTSVSAAELTNGDITDTISLFINGEYVEELPIYERQKPDYTGVTSLDKNKYSRGEQAQVTLSAKTYAGNTLTDGSVKMKVTYDYSDTFRCGAFRTDSWSDNKIENTEYEIKIPQDGVIKKTFKIPEMNYYKLVGVENYIVSGLGNSMASFAEAQYFPADYLLLYNRGQNDHLVTGSKSDINIVKYDPSCKKIVDKSPITVKGVVEYYERKLVNDARKYEYIEKTKQITPFTVSPDVSGNYKIEYKYDIAGDYTFTVETKDTNGRVTATDISNWISDANFVSFKEIEDPEFNLRVSKEKYEFGDPLVVRIENKSVRGPVWVSLVGDNIFENKIVDVNSDRFEVTFPYQERLLPNLKVVAGTYVKDSYLFSETEAYYDTEIKNIVLDIKTDKKEYKPGENVNLDIKAVNAKTGLPVSADLSIAVTDKAMIDIDGAYRIGEEIFEDFWHEKYINYQDASSLNIVYPMYGGGMGGGGDSERSDFKDVAFWLPNLRTDSQGNARASFKLPDNLGTFSVVVVANTSISEFGFKMADFKVNLPLALEMKFPKNIMVGDEPYAYCYVSNNTATTQNVTSKIEASGLKLLEDSNKSITVPSGQTRVLSWKLKAEAPQSAKIKITATGGGFSDSLEYSTNIVSNYAIKQNVENHSNSFSSDVKFDFPEKSEIKLSIAPSLRSVIPIYLGYFDCLDCNSSEDISTNIAVKSFAFTNYPKYGKYLNKSQNQLAREIEYLQIALYKAQNKDGGWAWWYEEYFTTDFTSLPESSAQVMETLKMSEIVRPMPGYIKDPGIKYLKDYLGSTIPKDGENGEKFAYAAYVLSLYEPVSTSNLRKLEDANYTDSSMEAYMALASKNSGNNTLASFYKQKLMSKLKKNGNLSYFDQNTSIFYKGVFNNAVKSDVTALALKSLMSVEPTNPEVLNMARFVVTNSGMGENLDRQALLNSILVLDEVVNKMNIKEVSQSFQVLLNEKVIKEGKLDDNTGFTSVSISQGLQKENKLEVKIIGSGESYTDVAIKAAYPFESAAKVNQGKYLIQRHVYNLAHQESTTFNIGDRVIVELKINVPSVNELFPLLVREFLPGGIEYDENYYYYPEVFSGSDLYASTFLDTSLSNKLYLSSFERKSPGTYTIKYTGIAITPGIYSFGVGDYAAKRNPAIFGAFEGGRVEIKKASL